MTINNRHQAAQVIRTWQQRHKNMMDDDPDWAAQNLTGDLHNAGLIAPDLPEANDQDISTPGEKLWLPCGPTGPSVWARPGGRVRVRRIEPGDLTPAEARFFALAVLAAADYSEGSNE